MRKSEKIVLNDRGTELTFVIREMPATQAERWLLRAALLLAGAGILEHVTGDNAGEAIGKAGHMLAEKGITALGSVDFEKAEPLLNELLSCCSHIDKSGAMQQLTPTLVDGVIQDVRTLFQLQVAAIKVNFGFFLAGGNFHVGDS